jgi:two-component system sensor histidine kinase YesM
MRRLLKACRKIYRRSPISQKLFMAFSLMIAIPAILVSFLFIRIQEAQIYKEAVSTANSHVTRLNEQIRSRLGMIESVSRMALAQRAFIDFIHSDMREDGLRLVKFRQNEFEHMHTMILSFRMIESLSFYVDNPDLYEIWPEIYHYERFEPKDYWVTLREQGGASYRLFALQEGDQTLGYYRLVRLSGSQLQPMIMEIRVPHRELFGDLLGDRSRDWFTVILDSTRPDHAIFDAEHPIARQVEDGLGRLLAAVLSEMDMLNQTDEPVETIVDDHRYYAVYRYIAPLQAYVLDIASHQTLMQGPRNMYALVIVVTCCVLLLMLLLVSHTTRRIFRRLDSVLASMRKVRKGDLNAKIRTGLESHETGDEIDEVAVSYNDMLDEIQRLMTQVIDKQLVAKNAQLHSLHSQINSHFLYNALESIRMLAEVKRQPEIADVLVSLGSLMRYSMKWQSDTVLLQEELTNIRNYIRFMNFMEGGNLRLQEHIPQDLLRYTIPKMCMQPIVENAVHHAAPKGGSVRIQITAWVADDSMLLIEIRDDGTGIEPQMLANLQAVLRGTADAPIVASKNGLGLENVHKRLQLHYGQDSGLRIDSVKGSYTCVTIRLPWRNSNLGGW